MKTREQIYGREAASLLRYISMYHVLQEEQLFRFFPGKRNQVRNLLSYFVKQGRIWHTDGLYCASPECAQNIDRGLLTAVWVLLDFLDRTEYHAVGDFPAKIIFSADGEVYEIVCAEPEREALLARLMNLKTEEPPHYVVLVDNPSQIAQLNLPNVCGYCTVSADGKVEYYQKG